MNKYDMDDLIIEDEDIKEKKPKKILAIIALVIIILLAGMMIMKSFIGGDSKEQRSELKDTKSVDRELEPIKSPIKVSQKGGDDEDELKPITDDELPALPMPKEPKREDSKKDNTVDIPSSMDSTKKITDTQPKHIQESKRVEHKRREAVKVEPPKTTIRHIVKEIEHKKRNQPSHRVEKRQQTHTTHVAKKGRRYYVQVGSFSRPPTKEYLDNIKSKGYHYKFFRSGKLIKVRVGPYSSYDEAKSKLLKIKSDLGLDGFVVRVK